MHTDTLAHKRKKKLAQQPLSLLTMSGGTLECLRTGQLKTALGSAAKFQPRKP